MSEQPSQAQTPSQPGAQAMVAHPIMHLDRMIIRKNFWVLFGAKFRILDPNQRLLAMSKQKAFKLKEDITVFSDAEMTQPLLRIGARQIVDFSAAYDIIDVATDTKVGAMRRRGWKSILKDEWIVLDQGDVEIGRIKEDSGGMAALRRLVSNLVPQTFHIEIGGALLGTIKQHFNPFVFKATMDLSADQQRVFDRRLAIGAAVLLLAIEGRQR